MPSLRPRRLFLVLLSIPAFFLLFLYLGSPASHWSLTDLFSRAGSSKLPDEIFGLLHFVTSPDEADRVLNDAPDVVAPENGQSASEQPVALTWYALGSMARMGDRMRASGQGRSTREGDGWDERLGVLREEYPLVVFSKSYCPYSSRAKRLLERYELSPPPKIIEVDLRADGSHIKTLLTRLTGRSTFPNVILHGRSLGGSDDLIRLHQDGRLRQILMGDGVNVRWSEEGSDSGSF